MLESSRLTLRLARKNEAGATEIGLTGVTASVPPPSAIHQLLALLAICSRGPVRVVLAVDGTDGDTTWALRWDDGFQGLGLHQIDLHLEVRGIPGTILAGHER